MKKKKNTSFNPYNSWAVYLRLLHAAAPYWLSFVLGILGTIIATSIDAYLIYSIKPILDNWTKGSELSWFCWLPLIIILVLSLRSVAYFFSTYYLTQIGRNIVRDFRQRIFDHLLHLPASYYDRETSGKLLSTLIYNTEQVATAATEALITVLQESFFLVSLLVTMSLLSWQLTIMFLITAPAISIIIRFASKRLRRLSSNVQGTMGKLTEVAAESIENYKVVRIFGGENYEKEKFFSATQQNCQREMKVVTTSSAGSSLAQIVTSLPVAVIIFIATGPLYTILSVTSLGAFFVAIIRMLTPVRRLTKINTEIQKGVAGAHSIFYTIR